MELKFVIISNKKEADRLLAYLKKNGYAVDRCYCCNKKIYNRNEKRKPKNLIEMFLNKCFRVQYTEWKCNIGQPNRILKKIT